MNQLSFCKEGPDTNCGRLCSHDKLTHLMTRLALVEGSILERLEGVRMISLHELMELKEWEPCAIAMAVGSLVRQGMIRSIERDQEVFLVVCGDC